MAFLAPAAVAPHRRHHTDRALCGAAKSRALPCAGGRARCGDVASNVSTVGAKQAVGLRPAGQPGRLSPHGPRPRHLISFLFPQAVTPRPATVVLMSHPRSEASAIRRRCKQRLYGGGEASRRAAPGRTAGRLSPRGPRPRHLISFLFPQAVTPRPATVVLMSHPRSEASAIS